MHGACYGAVRVIEDREWLRQLVDDLTSTHEPGRVAPWALPMHS